MVMVVLQQCLISFLFIFRFDFRFTPKQFQIRTDVLTIEQATISAGPLHMHEKEKK